MGDSFGAGDGFLGYARNDKGGRDGFLGYARNDSRNDTERNQDA